MKKIHFIVIGLLVLHFLFLLKLKFTAWPEMLLWPYLLIHGILPYRDIAIAHTPNLIVDLALFYKIFGVGITQLKAYTWILILFTDILVFWLTKKLKGQKMALLTVSLFAFWQLFFDGNGLWFDLTITPIALLTFFFLEKKKYFWTGIFWAVMFFTKQTAVWFLIPVLFNLLQKPFKKDHLKSFVIGVVSVTVTAGLILWGLGIFPAFFNWAINFGIFTLPRLQGQIQLPGIKNILVTLFPFLIFIPYILKEKHKGINLTLWAVAGAMGTYPRFEFFHFQPALPFLAIASALVFNNLNKTNKLLKMFIPFYLIGSIYLFANFFMRNYQEGTRFFEKDVVDIVGYVKDNTEPGDKIFVMNWWDNIYALTETIPGTNPWVPQLSWYQEMPGIQDKEVEDLKKSKPKLILLQSYSETGLSAYKPQKLYNYVVANYKLKEKVDGIEILIPKN